MHRLAVDAEGRFFTGDVNGVVRIYDHDGNMINDWFATGLGESPRLAIGPGGVFGNGLYVANQDTGELWRFEADGNRTLVGSGFQSGFANMAFGPDGAFSVPNSRRIVCSE